MNKKIWLGLALFFVLVLTGCSSKTTTENNPAAGDGNNNQSVATTGASDVNSRGSCNIIADRSQCVDYVGSIWTKSIIGLSCGKDQGGGSFSSDACPHSANGGCRVMADTNSETIIWSYPYGGSPVTGGNLITTKGVCEATPDSEWISE